MKYPDGHVNYEINSYTFSDSVLNEDKNYCPVCGKLLISERENKQSISYVKHDTKLLQLGLIKWPASVVAENITSRKQLTQ